MNLLNPVLELFNHALKPIAPFTWFGLNTNTLDVLAAFRLCFALRQIKDRSYAHHVSRHGNSTIEDISFVRSLITTLLVVYGGETMISSYFCNTSLSRHHIAFSSGPLMGVTPSFVQSGVFPGLYIAVQAIVDYLPYVPPPILEIELPLAVVDAFTRAMLLCTIIPPTVITNPSTAIATSPWTLLLTSIVRLLASDPNGHPRPSEKNPSLRV
jgi:hypothetical protein